jgi:hypothetical protein
VAGIARGELPTNASVVVIVVRFYGKHLAA